MKTKLLLAFTLISYLCYSQTLIIEDFESTAVGSVPSGWSVTNNGSGIDNQIVVDNPVKNGNHVFQLSAASNIASIRKTISNLPEKVTLESWIYPDAILDGLSGAFGLVSTSSTSDSGIGFINGNIVAGGWEFGNYILKPYTRDTWYHLKMEMDLLNRTYQVFIDNELATANDNGTTIYTFSLYNGNNDATIYLNAGNSGNINIYFDDVKLYKTNPELIAHYPFNGNANDESGNGNHGVVIGASLTTDRFGDADSAYSFNGVDNAIFLSPTNTDVSYQSVNLPEAAITVSAWVKPNSYNEWESIVCFMRDNGIVEQYGFQISSWSNNKFAFHLAGGGNGHSQITTSSSFLTNTWYFVTATHDGATMKLYVNGSLETSSTNETGNIAYTNTRFRIGKYEDNNESHYFDGSIDEVKIYNKALTLEEIKNEYQGLVAYYPFNGNANDESGNGNHGTVNGATLATDRFGNSDSAYEFDGSTNYISITNNPTINIKTAASSTISFWLKHATQNNAKYMISKYKGSFGEPSYAIGTGSNGDSYSWHEFTASNGIQSRGNIDLNDNQWHHITNVFKSGESVSLYVDGVLDVQHATAHTGSISNLRDLTIGCGSNIAQHYNGDIDDIKIYNKALTLQEIQNLYNFNPLKIEKFDTSTESNFYVSKNILYFKDVQNLNEIKTVEVYNLLGQKIVKTSKIEKEISLEELKIGIYVLKVENNIGDCQTLRFLIN